MVLACGFTAATCDCDPQPVWHMEVSSAGSAWPVLNPCIPGAVAMKLVQGTEGAEPPPDVPLLPPLPLVPPLPNPPLPLPVPLHAPLPLAPTFPAPPPPLT